MADYKYRGMLRNGKIVRGVLTAKSKHQVIAKLKTSKIQPIMVKPMKLKKNMEAQNQVDVKRLQKIQKEVGKTAIKTTPKNKLAELASMEVSFGGIKPKDILAFTNSLYILKKAKFNNVTALESIYNTTQNKQLKDKVENILIGVEAGSSLHSLMAQYPKVFPALYVNFVKVGEESGSLDKALLYARNYMESEIRLKKQIRSILIPKIVQFVLITVGMIVALLFGTPMIQNVYDMFGVDKELPQATQVAIKISEGIVNYWYIILAVIAGIYLLYRAYVATAIGRYKVDRFKLKFPIFGTLNLNITMNRFLRAMLLNLRNGMRIQESLETSKSITSNYYFLSIIEVAKNNIQAGDSWVEPFVQEKAFSPMVAEMIDVGMKTDLVEMMDKIEEYIQQEIDETISKTVKALPEIMYIGIGIVLIFFVITVMVPLIDVYMGGFLFESV